MKLVYALALLIFGAGVGYSDLWDTTNIKEKRYVLYNDTDLIIAEYLNKVVCTYGDVDCYAECNFYNLTTNIFHAFSNNILLFNYSITSQKKIMVFNLSGIEVNCTVTKCGPDEIYKLMEDSCKFDALKELKKPAMIKKACPYLFSSNQTIKKAYVRAEKQHVDALISIPFYESTKNFDLEEFHLSVFEMNVSDSDPGLVQLSVPKVTDDDLLLDVFIPAEPFVNVSDEQRRVGVVNYPSADHFMNDQNIVLKSKVIRIETAKRELKDLPTRLVINFPVNNKEAISNNHTLACWFYNMDASQGQEWDDRGSFINLDHFHDGSVSCSYDHMTPFAVLLVDVTQIDHAQWKILSHISYIGCGLSATFSVIIILLYTLLKSSARTNSIHIHVSLSTAYFLLNTSFLLSEWGATWSQESLCVLVAVLIQYSLLSSFSWMACEAIHLYLLLIKVFNTYIKHYKLKLSLFGWGVPAVFVGASLCGYQVNPLYGTTKVKLSNSNQTTEFCWITDIRFLYGMNITYFSITFLFNFCILLVVSHRILKMQSVKSENVPRLRDIFTVLGLTFLVGMTWGLAFFTSGYINYPILYLFCIFNTLQADVVYYSPNLEFAEKDNKVFCHWKGFSCYVACTPADLSAQGQNNHQLIVNMSRKNLKCNVTKCESNELKALIQNMDATKLKKVQFTCKKIPSIFRRAQNKYIEYLISAPFNTTTQDYDDEDFNMTIFKMDKMNTADNELVQLSVPKVPGDPPLSVFVPIEPFRNVSENQSRVAVVLYRSAEQFTCNKPQHVLQTKVIGIEIVGRQLQNLTNPLVIRFTVNTSNIINGNYTFSCMFYDMEDHRWNDEGSFTNLTDLKSNNTVICSYNHMTPFAVLLVDMNNQNIDPVNWKILSYISSISCSISSIFSAVTIFLYIYMKSSERDNSICIHVSLSTAYFLLNTSFLFIEWGAYWQEDVCVIIAVIIEYSLLSSFSWLAIEAIHLYLLLVKVFNTYIKKYVVKLSLFGWGVPALLVGGSLCVYDTQPFYGIHSINNDTKLCWITDTRFLYGLNITYLSVILLFNTYVLVSVVCQIFKMRRLAVKCNNTPTHKETFTVLGLTFLLGMTWGLAFFASGYTNYPILYLFCLCNSLQGLFLFLWIYSTMKKKKHLTSQDSTMNTHTRTTSI